jgi:hypothetical protein
LLDHFLRSNKAAEVGSTPDCALDLTLGCDYSLCRFQCRLQFLVGNYNHTIVVTDQPVARANHLTGALHGNANLSDVFRPTCGRNYRPRKHGQPATPNAGYVSNRSIDYDTSQALAQRGERSQFAPQRHILLGLTCDDQNVMLWTIRERFADHQDIRRVYPNREGWTGHLWIGRYALHFMVHRAAFSQCIRESGRSGFYQLPRQLVSSYWHSTT